MKENKNKSIKNPIKEDLTEPKSRFVQKENDRELTQLFIFERVIGDIEKNKKSKDTYLDKLSEVKNLLSYAAEQNKEIINRIDLAADSPRQYKSMFPKEFYEAIYRLNGWDIELASRFRKKREVAVWTRELIYGRFNKEVLKQIEKRNPYVGFCKRGFYHHQFLTPEGASILARIIYEAIDLMSKHQKWKDFRREYLNRFKLAYQTSLFED